MLVGCTADDNQNSPVAVIVKGSGNVQSKLDEFRTLLGSPINTTTGQTVGRREINWDGVPELYATQKLPSDFFNPVTPGSPVGLQRGFIYSPDIDARISSNLFVDRDSSYASQFETFSGTKTFSAVNSNLWNVDFEVAGERRAGFVHGFGAVFSDVDEASSTSIEFFSGNRSLGRFQVPVRTNSSYSFLGVYFPFEKVTRVQIVQGNGSVTNGIKDISNGGQKDLVIMDDFLYDEPQAIQ